MILSLKAWKSRSLPGLPKTENLLDTMIDTKTLRGNAEGFCVLMGRAPPRVIAVLDPVIHDAPYAPTRVTWAETASHRPPRLA